MARQTPLDARPDGAGARDTTARQANELHARLARLERHNRTLAQQNGRLRMAGAAALVLIAAVAALGAAAPKTTDYSESDFRFKTVEAGRFYLVDENDELRAVLGLIANDPVMRFYDTRGKNRLSIGLTKGQPGVTLVDAKGVARVSLMVDGDKPGLHFWDEKSRTRSLFGVDKDGAPILQIYDENGKVIWKAP